MNSRGARRAWRAWAAGKRNRTSGRANDRKTNSYTARRRRGRACSRSLISTPFLVNLLITVGGGVGYYLTSGYMPTFLRVMLKIPAAATSAMLIAGSLVTIVAAISVGALAWRRR